MGIRDWFRGRKVSPSTSPAGGLTNPQAGFQSGTDGLISLPLARYNVTGGPGITAGYGHYGYWGGPGAELARERAHVAAVTMDLLTSNPTVATLIETLSVYALGEGLVLSAKPDAEMLGITPDEARAFSVRIEKAWNLWANNPVECDANGRHTIHQLATAVYRSWLMQGEGVACLDWRRVPGAASRTKAKLLDPRQIDPTITRANEYGNAAQGVQFDKDGRYIGLWVREVSLGAWTYGSGLATYIPARTTWGRPKVLHLYDLLSAGMVRGISPLAAALSSAHSKATLREFSLVRALVESMVGVTIESDSPTGKALDAFNINDGLQLPGGTANESGNSLDFKAWAATRGQFYADNKISLQPGSISHLAPNDKLKLHKTESPSQHESFDRSLLREAATSAGSSYESVSGDYSLTSFSAARLAHEMPARGNKRRRSFIVRPFYQSVYEGFLEEALETGAIELPRKNMPPFWKARSAYAQASWRGEGKPIADVSKQAEADALELACGLSTLEMKLAERGLDLESTLEQIKVEKALLQDAGISWPTLNGRIASKPEDETQGGNLP